MTAEKCRMCSDLRYKNCPAPNVITNGRFCCEKDLVNESSGAKCDHCGERLVIGHFAYETNWKEFWCEICLRELLEKFESEDKADE